MILESSRNCALIVFVIMMRTYNCVTLHSLPSVVTHSYPHSHPVSYVAINVVEVMRKLMLGEMSVKLKVSARKWQGQKPTPRLLWTQPPGSSLPRAFLSQQTGTNIGWHSHSCALCPAGGSQADFPIASKPITSACWPSLGDYEVTSAF